MILASNILFLIIFFALLFYYFKNFSYLITFIFPFAIFFGSYISFGGTAIHVAEIFTPLLLLKNPFAKKNYNQLDIIFFIFFILGFFNLTFNSPLNFLYLKTIMRFFEILIVYFTYSKYGSIIKLHDIHKSFLSILILILIISVFNLIFISFYDSYAWMKLLIKLGYIPQNVESYGYLDSWSSNNSVQGNYLIEHQYGIMLVSSFYLSLARKNILITITTLFFLFFTIHSTSVQISLVLSLLYYYSRYISFKIPLYLFVALIIPFSMFKYYEDLNLIFNQIVYLFEYGKIVEVSSVFIRLNYLIEGFSHPKFNWLTGIGLNIFNYNINPHEMFTYFYFIYGLPCALIFILIFYNRFQKVYSNSSINYILKSYFLFSLIVSFGINYFTSIVTFFPFILFLNYTKFVDDKNCYNW